MSVQLAHRTLVRAIEVWRLDVDQQLLTWSSGTYDAMADFEVISREMTFQFGEGLPGLVWQNRSPLVLHSLLSGEFKRAATARTLGLSCGIGLPFFREDEFLGVLVFLCDDGQEVHGAFEVWAPNDRRELGLSDSYYANLAAFSRLSQFVKFPCGAGLPGQTWQMRFPRVIDSLPSSPAFMRGAGARAERLQVGLGIPFMKSAWDLDSVVVMLSSADTPLARVFEVWIRDGRDGLKFHSGSFRQLTDVESATVGKHCAAGEGVAGAVLAAGMPIVTGDCIAMEQDRAELLEQHALSTAVGMPIYVGSTLVSVVVMLL